MGRRSLCGSCGECERCKRAAYMRGWYRVGDNAERQRASQRASRNRRIEEVRAYDRARGHRVYDVEKERARAVVNRAVASGQIERQPCEICGIGIGEAHHDDYTRPLDVRWLCRPHHAELHRKV